jgi:hypothetical protein
MNVQGPSTNTSSPHAFLREKASDLSILATRISAMAKLPGVAVGFKTQLHVVPLAACLGSYKQMAERTVLAALVGLAKRPRVCAACAAMGDPSCKRWAGGVVAFHVRSSGAPPSFSRSTRAGEHCRFKHATSNDEGHQRRLFSVDLKLPCSIVNGRNIDSCMLAPTFTMPRERPKHLESDGGTSHLNLILLLCRASYYLHHASSWARVKPS